MEKQKELLELINPNNADDIIYFTNTDTEEFEGYFGRNEVIIGKDDKGNNITKVYPVKHTIKPGETKPFPRYKVYRFAKQLADKMLLRDSKVTDYNDISLRKPIYDKCIKELEEQSEPEKVEEQKTEEFADLNQQA